MEAERRAPKSEALGALDWRSETLQLLSGLRGEGLGDLVDPLPAITAPTAGVACRAKRPPRAPLGEPGTTADEHAGT